MEPPSADPHARWCGGCRQQWRRLPDFCDRVSSWSSLWKPHYVAARLFFTTPKFSTNAKNVVSAFLSQAMTSFTYFFSYCIMFHHRLPLVRPACKLSAVRTRLRGRPLSILDRSWAFAMCLKFQVNNYFTPLVAAREICIASRGSVSGIALTSSSALANSSASDEPPNTSRSEMICSRSSAAAALPAEHSSITRRETKHL